MTDLEVISLITNDSLQRNKNSRYVDAVEFTETFPPQLVNLEANTHLKPHFSIINKITRLLLKQGDDMYQSYL